MARVITEETLFELINLAAGPQKYLPSGLQVDTTLALDLVCTLNAAVALGRQSDDNNSALVPLPSPHNMASAIFAFIFANGCGRSQAW